jgi:hypothetical protein
MFRRFDLDANTAGPSVVISHDVALALSSLGAIYIATVNGESSVLPVGQWFILGKISHLVRDDKWLFSVVIPSGSEKSLWMLRLLVDWAGRWKLTEKQAHC